MDYLWVTLAVLGIAVQFSLNKAYQKRFAKGIGSLLVFPILTGCASAVFFLCLAGFRPQFNSFTFVMALLYAAASSVSIILGLVIVRLGKLSVYMIFLMLGGMLLPFLYGVAFLDEIPTAARIVGMIILTASLFVPFLRFHKGVDRARGADGTGETAPGDSEGQGSGIPQGGVGSARLAAGDNAPRKSGKPFIFLCVCVFILNGCVSIVSKAHQIGGAVLETGQFLIWANLWSFALSAAAYGLYRLYSRLWAGGAARDARDISCGGTPAPAGETDGNGKEHTEYAPKSIPNLPEEIAAGDFPIGGGGSGRTAEEGAGGVSAPKPAAAKRMPLKNAATKPAAAKRAPLKNAALAAAFVIVIALIGCAGGLLMLNSAKDLPASVLYPMVTGGVIILSAVSGRLFFGEKTTPQILASLGLTLIGTLFLF